MAASRTAGPNHNRRDLLTEILDFGDDAPEQSTSSDLGERIRKVKEKIAEINERIQRLTNE